MVYGLVGKESSKCIHGGGAFVMPVFQSYKYHVIMFALLFCLI